MSVVSFAPFRLVENALGDNSVWCHQDGVTSGIDLTAPGKDSIVGYDPSVNLAIVVSDDVLPDAYYTLGSGNATDIVLSGADIDAWESITGKRPTQGIYRLSDVIADHLLLGADPTGTDFAKPLTAGANRGLEIHLGGEIWSHTISDWNDQFARPVIDVEAEWLAEIYRTQGETQYRLALGGLHRKYNFYGPVKDLIAYLYSGREDLPPLDELWPNTVITENWPTNGAITSGQNNTWTQSGNTWTVSGGVVSIVASATRGYANLQYAFGTADRTAAMTIKQTPTALFGTGPMTRSNQAITSYYQGYTGAGSNAGKGEIYKSVSGTLSLLKTGTLTLANNSIFNVSSIGSLHAIAQNNGATNASVTDTANASGSYSAFYCYSAPAGQVCSIVVYDDQQSSSNRRRRVICTGGR